MDLNVNGSFLVFDGSLNKTSEQTNGHALDIFYKEKIYRMVQLLSLKLSH